MQSITRQLAFDARTISLRRSAQKKRTETKNWRANLHDPISGTNEWTADELKSNAVPVMIPGNAPDYLHGMLSYNRVYPPKLSGLSDQFDRHLIVAVDKGVKECAKVTSWVVDNIYRSGDLIHLIHVSDQDDLGGYMLPPDGLWTLDAAIARYNSADRAAQSKFWENELKATELLLEDILKQTYDLVRKKHDERAFALNEAVPEPAIELDAILNVKFNTTSEIIAQKALDINASMIVVIKHDKSWFTKIIEGSSVADSVMRKANCPVLVYHATPSQTKEEETKMKEKEAKRPGGKHASQTKL